MTAVESLTCPTCGAPLSLTSNETEVKCEFCGNVVRVASAKPAAPAPPPIPNIIVRPQIYVPASRPSPSLYLYGRRGSCAYTLVVLVFVFVMIGVVIVVGGSYGGNLGNFLNDVLGHGTTVLATFGGKGTGPGLWDNAQHMAVDGKGFVYVADQKTGRIQRFDANGKYVSYWDVPLQYTVGPDCLTADRTGNVYVCEGGQLLKYDGAAGERLGSVGASNGVSFKTAAATLDGGLVASDGDTVLKIDANGHITDSYSKIISSQLTDTFGVEGAVDGLGNMYFLNPFDNVVLLYSADGKYINRFGSHGRGADQFSLPASIAVDAQSQIYIGDRGNIKVFDNTGRYLNTYTIPGTIYSTYSLAFDDSGNLYALCMDNADNEQAQVFKIQIANQTGGKS